MMDFVVNEHMWEQKYRPQKLADCILPEMDRKTFAGMIKAGRIGHTILVSKSPGTGKTTMAEVLCMELDAEWIKINGSDCTVSVIREKLTKFASTKTMKPGGKIIIIDEFDRKQLQESQLLMRAFMEAYSHNCSIIITANNADGIIEPLKSRSTVIEFGKATEEDAPKMWLEMTRRLLSICEAEGVEVSGDEGKKSILSLVKSKFPDLRSCITTLNRYAKTGKIDAGMLSLQSRATNDMDDLIDALRNKKFAKFRALVPNFAIDYSAFITKFYERIFKEVKPESLPIVIEAIGRNQASYANVANLEIHVSWMLTEIMLEVSWK
ncbi:clamp loader of DNA polymerase [Cronobacter phage S13]|jgi:DNA polymerase III delta prime subunit|uniref:clamp loader of DNA polymerase n=1 Tax=Cronobacter phage S13 TaxID=1327935 RepID=UPI000499DAB7|nr:clamp loader of DNA polymerase [Cronobacter phage S13]AIA65044.1 putative clamp loader subunit [Cronobacter phage S13]